MIAAQHRSANPSPRSQGWDTHTGAQKPRHDFAGAEVLSRSLGVCAKVDYEQPGNSEGSCGPWGQKQVKNPDALSCF